MRVALLLLLGLIACDDDRPPPPRGVQDRFGAGPGTFAPAQGTPEEAAPMPERSILETIEVREERTEAPQEEEEPRDLNAELRAAIGSPAGCGSFGDRNGRIAIRFSATLTETGIVSRGQVAGPVPQETVNCLQARLGRVRLQGPIENAPQTATAVFEMELSGATPERRTPTPPPAAPAAPGYVTGTPIGGAPSQAIHGPQGEGIRGDDGTPIQQAPSSVISGSGGTQIHGPSGVPIGQ